MVESQQLHAVGMTDFVKHTVFAQILVAELRHSPTRPRYTPSTSTAVTIRSWTASANKGLSRGGQSSGRICCALTLRQLVSD